MCNSSDTAVIRICASCRFVFDTRLQELSPECPVCYFGSYGARYVLGKNYYSYLKHQKEHKELVREKYAGLAEYEINKNIKKFKERITAQVFNKLGIIV